MKRKCQSQLQTINTLHRQFPKPKDKIKLIEQTKGIIYKIRCSECDFTYTTDKQIEHSRQTCTLDKNSKIHNKHKNTTTVMISTKLLSSARQELPVNDCFWSLGIPKRISIQEMTI